MENINPNGETNLLLKGAQYLFAGLLLGVFGGILCIVYWLMGEDGESIARLTAIFVGIVELYAFRLMECGDDKTDYFNKAGKAQLFCLILMILSFLMNFLFVRNLNMPYKAINLAVSIACIVITIIVAQYLGKGLSISCRDRDNKLADLFDVYRIIMLAFGFQYIVLLIIASISSFIIIGVITLILIVGLMLTVKLGLIQNITKQYQLMRN